MVTAVVAERLPVLETFMEKQLSDLTSGNTFLFSLWTQSLILGHTMFRKVYLCDVTACSLGNELSVTNCLPMTVQSESQTHPCSPGLTMRLLFRVRRVIILLTYKPDINVAMVTIGNTCSE